MPGMRHECAGGGQQGGTKFIQAVRHITSDPEARERDEANQKRVRLRWSQWQKRRWRRRSPRERRPLLGTWSVPAYHRCMHAVRVTERKSTEESIEGGEG